jgi:hypothetical protein
MATNQDIFGKPQFGITHPITADQIYIQWEGVDGSFDDIYQATNVQLQYQQSVSRRYTLSSQQNQAVIIPGRPIGTMTIGRLFVGTQQDIFTTLLGWNVCLNPATIHINLSGANATDCSTSTGAFQLAGCYVTAYSFQGNADDLQVVDNITIEFLQLLTSGWSPINVSQDPNFPPTGPS